MGEERPNFESYKGREDVYKRVQKMIEQAGSHIRIMTTENGIVRMYKVREKTYEETINERDVSVSIALPITKDNLWFVERFIKMGAEIKHLPESARNRFVNIDRKEVIAHFTSQDNREIKAENDYGVWTNAPEFVELTQKFFDTLWRRLETYQERRRDLKFGVWKRPAALLRFLIFIFYYNLINFPLRDVTTITSLIYQYHINCILDCWRKGSKSFLWERG